ncbi:hypothetical protein MMC06_005932 [Schaereria dolodes]|nr:hypothetical protein [Schaereria dolodes]
MAAQQQQRVRRVILTASVAAITATGAWYGAGLKVTQERKKEVAVFQQITSPERISQLESAKEGLMVRKKGLEKKIRELEGRQSRLENVQRREGEGE